MMAASASLGFNESDPHYFDEAFHIQNVNVYDSRLKQWMGRFDGGSHQVLRCHDALNPSNQLCRAPNE